MQFETVRQLLLWTPYKFFLCTGVCMYLIKMLMASRE